jgi:hypothetical protein
MNHHAFCSVKEDGSCLVGQCEIFHPIHRPSKVSISLANDDDNYDCTTDDAPTLMNDLDSIISKPQNILFEAAKKDKYLSLGL